MSRRNPGTSVTVADAAPSRNRFRSHRVRRRVPAMLAAAALVLGLGVAPAGADDDLTVSPDEVVRAEPGSVVTVAQEAIPAELVGQVCSVRIATANGSSVHPGNAVITTTGGQSVETPGVEDSPEGQVTMIDSLTLGDTLTLQLRMGPDGLSSLGFTVAVDCPDPTPAPARVESPPATDPPEASTPTVLPAQQVAPPADPVTATPTFTG
ncbi:MAG: hypothetical protein AAFN30_19550 [Actinomycetota bacterium]